MSSLRLLHLANHGSTNIGNGALIFGSEKVLREDLGGKVNFIPEPWDDYTVTGIKRFGADFVDLVNNGSDGLIIGAAATLTGSRAFTNTGMRFDLSRELWPKISKPIVFYAISYRFWPPHQTYHNLNQLRQVMDYIINNPRILFSVRNDGSKEWLESLLGYNSEKIVAIPDPALYVPVTDNFHPELEEKKINILISLNNEDEKQRFGRDEIYRFSGRLHEAILKCIPDGVLRYIQQRMEKGMGWRGKKRRFLRNLAEALEKLSKDWDLNLILCPHSNEDYKIIGEFISLCSARFSNQILGSCGQLKVPRTSYFYDLYAKADAALSMRVHSMSPAVGLGTPLVALVSQPRMLEFMEDVGLQDLAIDIYDPDFTEKIYRLLTYFLEHRDEVKQRLQTVRLKMRERTLAYNRRITSLF